MSNDHKRWSFGADHIGDGSYMKRWLARTPKGSLRLHYIQSSDGRGDFHDHPFWFKSLILTGGYIDHVPGCSCSRQYGWQVGSPCGVYEPGDIVRHAATDLHWLELLDERKPTLTLVLAGPYVRDWGFQTRLGWIREDIYKAMRQRGEAL